MIRSLVLGLTLVAASPVSAQQILFADGFDTGSASEWAATRGELAYPSTNCHTGPRCGAATVRGGSPQQSVLWERGFSAQGSLYVSAWMRFPTGYSWDPAPGANSTEHKLFIVNTANDVGRLLVNLRGGGVSPVLQVHVERVGEVEDRGYSETQWPADGGWHFLEFLVNRSSSGRAQLWLDGRQVYDASRPTCGSPCSPVIGMQVGAYVNQGATRTQTFYLDDVRVADGKLGGGNSTPPPANDARAEALEAIAQAVEALERATTALEQ